MQTKDFQYKNKVDQREKMWWGKDCRCCRENMSESNTTDCSEKSGGWGHQFCDFCSAHTGVTPLPCEKWSEDKKSFWNEHHFIDHDRFDRHGKILPFTGKAARIV